MSGLVLTIGDKALSSWSFRPWFMMTAFEIPFREETILLDRPESRANLKAKSPAGLVPFLTHGDFQVWDSLAIMEYVSDLYPEKACWPEDVKARAFARAVSAEMHSGFSALRNVWPMNVVKDDISHVTSGGVAQDIARIDSIWSRCRRDYGSGGPFLFGKLSIADAMYAPVVSRFKTYGPVNVSDEARAYMETIAATGAWAKWIVGAREQIAAERP